MSDPYDAFPSLTFEHPEPGILEIVLDAPGLNAVNHQAHRDLAEVDAVPRLMRGAAAFARGERR